MHSYSNGLQDLPDSVVLKSSLNPDDIVDKYKDALMYYSKVGGEGSIVYICVL